LSPRRRSTLRHHRITAHDYSAAHELPAAPKSVELEQRLARVEICCREMQALLDHLVTQSTALRAEIDFLSARLRILG
jgi:hypothetical protein